jgi:ribulose 1,5-bisphosphate synthetase/thiazole synthase
MVEYIFEAAKELPVRLTVDVLVVGGGPSGIIAAQAAADDGLNVTLIDSRSFLGGNMTIGLPIFGLFRSKR